MHLMTYSRLKFIITSLSTICELIGIWVKPMKMPPVIFPSCWLVYHGCLRISCTRYLIYGFVWRMFLIMSLADSLAALGILHSLLRIFYKGWLYLGLQKEGNRKSKRKEWHHMTKCPLSFLGTFSQRSSQAQRSKGNRTQSSESHHFWTCLKARNIQF